MERMLIDNNLLKMLVILEKVVSLHHEKGVKMW